MAFRLAEEGHRVMVLEKRHRLDQPVCCTGIIGQECARNFDIDNRAILRRATGARLYSPSGRCLRLYRPTHQACITDRAIFNGLMAARAQSKGAEYALGTTAEEIDVGEGSVVVSASAQGGHLIFESRAVVIAAGFSPQIYARLKLGKINDYVGGAQVEAEVEGVDEIEVYFGRETAPGFFAWLVPTLPGRALVGLLSRRSPGLYLMRFLSYLSGQGKVLRAGESGYGVVPLKPLPRTYGHRLLVVGDAAGQVKPTTGGGIYYGLLCADIAANTLLGALAENNLSAGSLHIYERQWQSMLARELRIGYWARKLYERLSDSRVDRIFDIINSNGIVQAVLQSDNVSFDWHGGAIMKAFGHAALSEALGILRPPGRLTGR